MSYLASPIHTATANVMAGTSISARGTSRRRCIAPPMPQIDKNQIVQISKRFVMLASVRPGGARVDSTFVPGRMTY